MCLRCFITTLCYISFIVDSKRYFNKNHYSELTIPLKCSSILPDKMLCLLSCCYTNYDWFEWVICESPLAYVVQVIFFLLHDRHLTHMNRIKWIILYLALKVGYLLNNIVHIYIYQAYQQHYVIYNTSTFNKTNIIIIIIWWIISIVLKIQIQNCHGYMKRTEQFWRSLAVVKEQDFIFNFSLLAQFLSTSFCFKSNLLRRGEFFPKNFIIMFWCCFCAFFCFCFVFFTFVLCAIIIIMFLLFFLSLHITKVVCTIIDITFLQFFCFFSLGYACFVLWVLLFFLSHLCVLCFFVFWFFCFFVFLYWLCLLFFVCSFVFSVSVILAFFLFLCFFVFSVSVMPGFFLCVFLRFLYRLW